MTATRCLTILLLAFTASACSQKPSIPETALQDRHTSRLSLDWVGRYQGTRPCADCPGIDTDVLLYPEIDTSGQGPALITEWYRDRSTEPTITEADYQWDANGRTILVSAPNTTAVHYLVGENQLLRLDQAGNRIHGDLADTYRLKKLSGIEALTGEVLTPTWYLTRLNGHPVTVETFEHPPTLQLTDQNIVSGHTGCNQLRGRFLVQGNQLTFDSLVSTRKACPPVSVESELLTSLAQVYRFRVPSAHTLHLFDKSGSLLMVLSANR